MEGYTDTGPTSVTVGAGWVGSQGRVYLSNGALAKQGLMTYNSGTLAANTYQRGYSGLYQSAAGLAYYSYGISAAWNGNGYTSYTTFKTPNANA